MNRVKAVAGFVGLGPAKETGVPSKAGAKSAASSLDFTSLYREHQGLVRSVIYQIAGPDSLDDLVQEAFIRIWKGMPGFRHDSQLSSWIYRVSTNIALDHCRSRARRAESLQISDSNEDVVHLPSPEPALASRDLVTKGLMILSEDHRATLVLSFLHDLPISEVAEAMEISEGTVKSRLHYAKAQFREFLASKGVKI